MKLLRSYMTLVVALAGLETSAATNGITLTTSIHSAAARPPVQAVLRAERIDGTRERFERLISIPATESIDLPKGSWELSIQTPLLWSEPRIAMAGQEIIVELWPVGTVTGTMQTEPPAGKVRDIRVAFAPAMEKPEAGSPSGETTCSVDGASWSCLLPEGTFDLRFLSVGYAAAFRWNQKVRQGGKVDLGPLTLRRGASLFGFVALSLREDR